MQRLNTISALRAYRNTLDRPIALVPTMGALHDGHLALIQAAKRLTDEVWVTIFVNPAQFGPSEDLARYPRPIEADLAACERAGVTVVFNPCAEEIYPAEVIASRVDVPTLTVDLEGAERPGHFAGVCRVVLKLLNICQPTFACFGQKDYQQLRSIECMVADLNLPVSIQRVQTVREVDGLALSSRNRYLDADQRQRAIGLYKSLEWAQKLIQDDGEADPEVVEAAMARSLVAHSIEPDYAVIRHPHTLRPLDTIDGQVVALIAGRLGQIRLLDNLVVKPI